MAEPPTNAANALPKFVGKYRIVRMIARSNDIVYEAVDPNLGRHIALKELVLAPGITGAGRRERIERFQREAKAAGALKHPNIVTIYEVGQHLDHRFIAMEYLDGQTLRDRINVGGPMPIKEAIGIALQLCDALGYAHQQGVVHRDVKPDNIHLIQPNSTVKLTDFGIARILSEPGITSIGQIFGTPSYMSPEQLTSRLVDHRTDIFSTGVVIFEMMTGKKPFRGDNVVAVTYQIMNNEVRMPPAVPPGITTILERAFKKDPDLQYQNMRSLAADLRHELAFFDSPYYVAPVSGGEAATPTLALDAATVNVAPPSPAASHDPDATVAVPTLTPARTNDSAVFAVADSPAQTQRAVVRLAATCAALLILALVTLWGVTQFALRLQDNIHYGRALALYNAANRDARSGNIDVALIEYRRALQMHAPAGHLNDLARRGESDCMTARAAELQTSGNSVAAQQSYLEAITTDFSNPTAHYDLATLYASTGDQANAVREYAEAHGIDPQSRAGALGLNQAVMGYLQLGNQQFGAGDTPSARQSWQKVIDLSPDSPQADAARGRLGS